MARWWKQLHALAVAGLCFGGAAAQAQQAGEPPTYYVPPAAHPIVYPYAAAAPAPSMPVYYHPPAAVSPGLQAAPALMVHPVNAPVESVVQPLIVTHEGSAGTPGCDGCNASGKKRFGGLGHGDNKPGCGCDDEGNCHPIRHFFLLDCWSHHDEHGCSSLCGEIRFAFGSCRDYFGEKCGPRPPPVPVPPFYTVLPRDVRSGVPVEVPPNPYPKAGP